MTTETASLTFAPRLAGKVALVTGGSRSIGAAIAQRLAAEGAAVAITYSASPANATVLVGAIKQAGGRAIAIEADSGDPAAVQAAIDETVAAFGGLDILVNNAGIMTAGGPLEEISATDYQRMLAVNVTGPFVAAQAAARHLKAGGRIINIASSMARYATFPGASVYTMTKAALVGLTRGLARDLGPRGITVNAISPGPVDTDMNPASGPLAEMLKPALATGRYGTAAEIASAVAYLASPEAGFVTGADWIADGGLTA